MVVRRIKLGGARKRGRVNRGKKLNKRQIREVKQIIGRNLELKSFPVYGNGTISNSPNVIRLSSIPSGVADGSRVGAGVVLKKFDFRYDLVVGDNYNNIRCIIFRWYENDGDKAPTWGDIMDDSAGSGYRYLQPYNHEQRAKYHIMYDSATVLANSYAFTSAGATTGSQASTVQSVKLSRKINVYGKRLGRKVIEFDSTLLTGLGHIYLFFVSDSAVPPNAGMNYCGRVLYHDA